jgi:crossover junction endodeoxyribonuclease RuvC
MPAVPKLAVGERYLGLDPGLRRTGYAILERTPSGPLLCEGGVLKSTPEGTLAARIRELADGLDEVLDLYAPRLMGFEQVFSFGKNPKTSLLLAHARGALLVTAARRDVPVVHYTPAQVKRLLTGSGRASKEQIQHAVRSELKLDRILEPNDVSDASAIALCLYHGVRFAA